MKFTLSWLKQHLDTKASVEELEDKLSLIGLEVEEVVDNGKLYEPFVVAEVTDAVQHPNADRLKVCKVNCGNDNNLQIVCGAPNARAGIKVVLAPVGTVIPANQMKIKASKIRDVESNGMLCSAKELDLGEDHEGIIELPTSAKVGMKFAEYANLNDTLFDIGLTPNRGDAANVYGVARDLDAAGLGKLIEPKHPKVTEKHSNTPVNIKIEDKENCSEFYGRYISNVTNPNSPQEISKFLRAVGSSPKAALVDISNYSMLGYGRPNHIYDADKIEGDIVVRQSKKGEDFVAIGGDEYKLPENIMVIADNKKVLAVAGVIGGELSKVTEDTKNILLEVANFDPIAIANAGRKLNIITDSRFRFERRIDHATTDFFMDYLTSLVTKHCGGEVHKVVKAKGNSVKHQTEASFSFDKIKALSGLNMNEKEAKTILERLGFKISGNKISIPSWRQGDIEGAADIIEEVLRIHGFDKVPSIDMPLSSSNIHWQSKELVEKFRETLASRGLNEIVSWSFMSDRVAQTFGLRNSTKVLNPISSDLDIMRKSIIPNLIEAAKKNLARDISNTGFFECGAVYGNDYDLRQTNCVTGIRAGKKNHRSVHKHERKYDFYDAKSDIFALISTFGLDPEKLNLEPNAPSYYHPGRSATLKLGKNAIGYCGEIHPKIYKDMDIDEHLIGFELFPDNLPELGQKHAKQKLNLSDLQSVTRDFAFIVDKDLNAIELIKVIKGVDKNLIEAVKTFDVYSGKGVDEDKKSIAISVRLQPHQKTLSDEEIEAVCKNIIDTVSKKIGASLR